VKSLGKAGELVRVKPGYARNFLLPRGLAFEATEGNKKRIAAETRARGARDQAERTEAERFAATLGAVTLTLKGKAGEEGKLFGSITAQDIADALAAQGHQVDRRRIELEHPIKTVGHHTVAVRLHSEVHAEVRVSVVAE
jgi:large subunit ribosomal protein L9